MNYRLAQPSDFQDVLTLLEGIFSGHDYLPLTFHQLLRRDDTKVLLAHKEGTLVGIVAGSVVDDGETCVLRSARVLPESRGRGVFRQMREALRCIFLKNNFPALCRERLVTQYAFLGHSAGAMQIAEYDVLLYHVSEEQRERHYQLHSAYPIVIEPCTKKYLSDVILSPPVAQKIFPGNTAIVCDSLPVFKPVRSNAPYMLEGVDCMFTDKGCNDAFPRSISFGSISPRVSCVHWKACVYTKDPALWEAHLISQFTHACQAINGEFFFYAVTNTALRRQGKNVLENMLELKAETTLFGENETVKVFEKELD